MTDKERGVIYVVTGAAHVAAARASAASVRRSNPGLALHLFTDTGENFGEFDAVEPIPNPHKRSKVDMLPQSPFAETLYLDTDTRVIGDLSPAFRLLQNFDLAVAHRVPDPKRLQRSQAGDLPPTAFPEHNSGVMFYRATLGVREFLRQWSEAYHIMGRTADQVSLREQLWKSDIRFATLPARFNTRKYTWQNHWFRRGAPPVVLHLNRFHPKKQGGLLRWMAGPGT